MLAKHVTVAYENRTQPFRMVRSKQKLGLIVVCHATHVTKMYTTAAAVYASAAAAAYAAAAYLRMLCMLLLRICVCRFCVCYDC